MLLTEKNAKTQTMHSDFILRKGASPGYLLSVTDAVGTNLCESPQSHLQMPYRRAQKKSLREKFQLGEAGTLPASVFDGREYVQQAESEWNREQCTQHRN